MTYRTDDTTVHAAELADNDVFTTLFSVDQRVLLTQRHHIVTPVTQSKYLSFRTPVSTSDHVYCLAEQVNNSQLTQSGEYSWQ